MKRLRCLAVCDRVVLVKWCFVKPWWVGVHRLLEFEGVGPVSLKTAGAVFLHQRTIMSIIMSIADWGWEHNKYAVDTPGRDQLKFYCRGFSATLVAVDPEVEGTCKRRAPPSICARQL
jgi:hypothetical protein